MTPSKTTTTSIPFDRWTEELTQLTRDTRGAHARLEVLGPEVGHQLVTDNRPFNGISADVKDGERSVWISFGSTPSEHLMHGIHNVTAIYMGPAPAGTAAVLEIEADDESKTLLTLSNPEAYELPSGS